MIPDALIAPGIGVIIAGVSGMLWLVWRAYDKAERAHGLAEDAMRGSAAMELRIAREFASAGKEFASVSYLKDVESRIMLSLERIEKRLDRQFQAGGHD